MNLFGRIAYKQFRGPQINCQPFHTHLVIMEPLARGRARCPHCDGQFWPGFGFNSHKARCAERKLILAGESGGDDTGGDGDTHCDGGSATTATPTAMNDESRPQCAVAELERHMAAAQGAPGCALACSSWGACELTAAEVETFRFLAVSDAGDGTSRRVATGMLQYARSLGGRASMLPKSMDKAWGMLTKVRYREIRTHNPHAMYCALQCTFYTRPYMCSLMRP